MENKVKKSSWEKYQGEKEKSYLNFLMDILIFFQCVKLKENVF